MAEYIERDELLKFKADVYDEDGHVLYAVPTGYIVAMPPADVATVRHGRWLDVQEKRLFGDHYFLCSNCKSRNGTMIPFNYCFNCGSRMDLEDAQKVGDEG